MGAVSFLFTAMMHSESCIPALCWMAPEMPRAMNKNDTAPIFEIADYGICGDLFKVTPMLIEAIKAAKAAK